MPISPARAAAFQILKRVATDGGYASDLLMRATQLDSRDAGLASQIVFGCLRYQAQLDHLALHFAQRKSLRMLQVELRPVYRAGVEVLHSQARDGLGLVLEGVFGVLSPLVGGGDDHQRREL